MPYLPGIDLATFDHDRAVTDVRIAFEGMGVSDWKSERRLREDRWHGRRPDGLFSLGKNRVALELELNRKRDDRYMQIFRSYDEQRDLDIVLYLCRTERLRQVVLGFARKSATPRRCYAALWTDWQEHETRTAFQGCFDRLSLMELVP